MLYRDRTDAGIKLGKALQSYANKADTLVLALPRGGVPIAFEVSRLLAARLDVFVVRKIGVPGHEELAMGAIASGGIVVLNHDVIRMLGIPHTVIQAVINIEQQELYRRERLYRGSRPLPKLSGSNLVLVDDGLATGASMKAAVSAVKQSQPASVTVAVPVGAASTCQEMSSLVDKMVCLATPPSFQGVGCWYRDFSQTSDEEVRRLLDQSVEFSKNAA